MTEDNHQIVELLAKLDSLLKRQDEFSKEIALLQVAIHELKNKDQKPVISYQNIEPNQPLVTAVSDSQDKQIEPKSETFQHATKQVLAKQTALPVNKKPKEKSDIEKFIGENLINKIGIAITVFGVAIGAKYSIENELISPLTRIIIGYLFALGLLGFGIKLKNKYTKYSAVLVSGAMTILYFITYAAYGLYGLMPQIMAFSLMLIFTVFTVVAAISFDLQVIAHIALVGAYAIPFLLSENAGNVSVLFSYMVIINIGILVISFKKYWKLLFYIAFALTWLILLTWYFTDYQTNIHFGLAFLFSVIFYAIFYGVFLAYKLLKHEKFEINNIVLLLTNSFVFYGLGYSLLNNHETGKQLLGVFTLSNALLHFIAGTLVYRTKLVDKNMQYLLAGLALVFITLAIPVQLDGNWVTLLWASEAALLFYIGRTKNVLFFEKLSYPLMILAFLSIKHDWDYVYDTYNPEFPTTRIKTLLNVNFLTSLLFIAAFGFIQFLYQKQNLKISFQKQNVLINIMAFVIPAILIYSIYRGFALEIATYWNQLYIDSEIIINQDNKTYINYYRNEDLNTFKSIWEINYAMLFVSLLAFLNLKKLKIKQLGLINLAFSVLTIIVFLTDGLFNLSELRASYLENTLAQYYQKGIINLWIRYVSYSFLILTIYTCYRYIKELFQHKNYKIVYQLLSHITLLWIGSSELINWMDLFGFEQSYKLGLSILWGLYALFLIAYGIRTKQKLLRVSAITLFGVTLIKLFFYDISHLNTVAKTIVFVSLGVLLLIVSFLYNKYKNLLSNDEGTTT